MTTAELATVDAATVIVDRRGGRLVVILCPYCGKRHTHGWPYGTPTIGSRLSHCRRDRRDYRIQVVP